MYWSEITIATASVRIPFTYRYGNAGWRSKPGHRKLDNVSDGEKRLIIEVGERLPKFISENRARSHDK